MTAPDYNYQQRPQTPEYQDGWDLIWGPKDEEEEDDESETQQ